MFTKETIENYFLSLKHEHLFLLMLAGLSLIVGLAFYFGLKKQFFKGFAIPLFSAAMLFFTLAFNNYKNADRIRKICTYDFDLHPEYLKTRELARVDSFILNASIVIYVCIFLILAAVTLYFYSKKKMDNSFMKGTALSLLTTAFICGFTFIIMKSEAKAYKIGILNFTKTIIIPNSP
jgi:uncharacterized membrane protein YphA (DoxX/SURF4 family)